MPRAGIVTVVGKPNAGKSTLLNRVMGEKLAIVSDKPQSTRDRVVGIHTTGDVQMIILDTPGLLNPRYELQRAMRGTALRALKDADIVIYLADATERTPPSLLEAAELDTMPKAPVWTVLNKADAIRPVEREELSEAVPDARFISALTGEGVDELFTEIGALLPESPFLYRKTSSALLPSGSSSRSWCARRHSSNWTKRFPIVSHVRLRSFARPSRRYTFGLCST